MRVHIFHIEVFICNVVIFITWFTKRTLLCMIFSYFIFQLLSCCFLSSAWLVIFSECGSWFFYIPVIFTTVPSLKLDILLAYLPQCAFPTYSSPWGSDDSKMLTIRFLFCLPWTLWHFAGILYIPSCIHILSIYGLCLQDITQGKPSLCHLQYVTQFLFHDTTCPCQKAKVKTT